MFERRVQVLLDDDRYEKLAREAARRGISIGALVRDAIDRLPVDDDQRRSAIAAILDAEPMAVPLDPSDLRAEIAAGRSRVLE